MSDNKREKLREYLRNNKPKIILGSSDENFKFDEKFENLRSSNLKDQNNNEISNNQTNSNKRDYDKEPLIIYDRTDLVIKNNIILIYFMIASLIIENIFFYSPDADLFKTAGCLFLVACKKTV